MSVIGVIEADLEVSGIGTRSRLRDELRGEPVLRRTVARALQAERLNSLHVVVHREQHNRAAKLLGDLPAVVETHDAPPPIWRDLVVAGRKWALDGWRGGLAGTCALDEGFHPAVVAALAKREGAEGVACIPSAAVVLDPGLLDRMVADFSAKGQRARITFTQAPPGLAAVIWDAQVLSDLGGVSHPPGRLLCYQPDEPAHDLVVSDCCYKVPAQVTHTAGRFLADNHRSMEMLAELFTWADGNAKRFTLDAVCRWQRERRVAEPEALPREVELELTTEDQLSESVLRPRGNLVGGRGNASVKMVERLVSELSEYDDSLLVLGGFGEPLLHPEFERILETCKPPAEESGDRGSGVFGLAVRTNAIALTEQVVSKMIDVGVDVVSVTLDATTAQTYRAVHGSDRFETVMAHVDALVRAREEGRRGLPIIVPEMVKVAETLPEMEDFFDHWMRKVGWANIEPYNSGADRRENRAVMKMAPPSRWACGRLRSRCLVLADGRVVRCDQDYTGAQPLGNLADTSFADIWQGKTMSELRQAHREGRWDSAGLCRNCQEWHRP